MLRGEEDIEINKDEILKLNDPNGFSVRLAIHPCGAIPIIEIIDDEDFQNVVRCLAYRCEAKEIQASVHAQAVSGLIHWGIIKTINYNERSELIILNPAPYSSLPSSIIPGTPTKKRWLNLSQIWRLEHELTHIATKRLVGEMRLNLFDELLADELGMIKTLELFSAELFRLGLGLNVDATATSDGRVHTYIKKLAPEDSKLACRYVLNRAKELVDLLKARAIPAEQMVLLRYLTMQQLDKPITSR